MATAIIVAGGSGRRMGGDKRKQYLRMGGMPVLTRTLRVFDACEAIERIFLVLPPSDMAYCRAEILEPAPIEKPVTLVPGGAERQASVHNGLLAVAENGTFDGIVAIHDGVRPFVTAEEIAACIRGAGASGAAPPARAPCARPRGSGPSGCAPSRC